jgi:hypothetical protein
MNYRQIQLENLLILLSNYQTSLERHPPIQLANEKEIEDYTHIVDNTGWIWYGTDIVFY